MWYALERIKIQRATWRAEGEIEGTLQAVEEALTLPYLTSGQREELRRKKELNHRRRQHIAQGCRVCIFNSAATSLCFS